MGSTCAVAGTAAAATGTIILRMGAWVIRNSSVSRAIAVRHVGVVHAVHRRGQANRLGRLYAHMAGRRCSRYRHYTGIVADKPVIAAAVDRRHRTTHAVRHQGKAKQGMQQERSKTHRRSLLSAFAGRHRSAHHRVNRGRFVHIAATLKLTAAPQPGSRRWREPGLLIELGHGCPEYSLMQTLRNIGGETET